MKKLYRNLVTVLVVIYFILRVASYLSAAGIEEQCMSGDDCRSGICLKSSIVSGYCTDSCRDASDCTDTTHCGHLDDGLYCIKDD